MVKIKNLDDGDFASNTNLNANVSNVIELKLHGNDHSNSSNNHEMKRCCAFFFILLSFVRYCEFLFVLFCNLFDLVNEW